MTAQLRHRWTLAFPLQPELGERLLTHWQAPERHYHGPQHLLQCLIAVDELGGDSPAELLALWFHDAIHHNRPGEDERASAELARSELRAAGFSPALVNEVARLVLTTIDHQPDAGDAAAARICDADLAILAATPDDYRASIRALRQEFPGPDQAWHTRRRRQIEAFLTRPQLFHTVHGQRLWEATARTNLEDERAHLPQ